MTNTIPNVPRELLERACTLNFMGLDMDNEVEEIRELLSRTPPKTVKILSAAAKVKEYEDVDGDTQHSVHFTGQKMPNGTELCRLSDAQAIIDGLRGEADVVRAASDNYKRIANAAIEQRDQLAVLLREIRDSGRYASIPDDITDRIDAALAGLKP